MQAGSGHSLNNAGHFLGGRLGRRRRSGQPEDWVVEAGIGFVYYHRGPDIGGVCNIALSRDP